MSYTPPSRMWPPGGKNRMHLLLCAHGFGSALYRGDTQAIFDGLDLTINLSKGQAYQECCRGTVGSRSETTGRNPTIWGIHGGWPTWREARVWCLSALGCRSMAFTSPEMRGQADLLCLGWHHLHERWKLQKIQFGPQRRPSTFL